MFDNNPTIKPNHNKTPNKSEKPEGTALSLETNRDYYRQCAKLEEKVALFKKNNPFNKFEVVS